MKSAMFTETTTHRKKITPLALWILGIFLCLQSEAKSIQNDPRRQVDEVTQAVVARLASARSQLDADPDSIKSIVAYLILPHFDFPELAAGIVKTAWAGLSEGERRCLSIGIRERLVERYARVLLEYEYENIVTDPLSDGDQRGSVIITQTVTTPHPQPLQVKYKMKRINDAWKVVDLIVADVSLVSSYRNSYETQIQQIGIGDFLRTFPSCRER